MPSDALLSDSSRATAGSSCVTGATKRLSSATRVNVRRSAGTDPM
jgi:hypothetical protein